MLHVLLTHSCYSIACLIFSDLNTLMLRIMVAPPPPLFLNFITMLISKPRPVQCNCGSTNNFVHDVRATLIQEDDGVVTDVEGSICPEFSFHKKPCL
jgi:hypothetical protein